MLSVDKRDQPPHLIWQPMHDLRKRAAIPVELGIPRLQVYVQHPQLQLESPTLLHQRFHCQPRVAGAVATDAPQLSFVHAPIQPHVCSVPNHLQTQLEILRPQSYLPALVDQFWVVRKRLDEQHVEDAAPMLRHPLLL